MKQIITIENEEIRLCSNLDEYSFGKTDFNSIVTQEGFIFDGEDFTPWTFSDVKAFNVDGKSDPIVFYCGKNPLSSNCRTLLEYFEEGGENCFKAAYAVCNALTAAAKNNEKIPLNGAGGIIVDLQNEEPKILFVPGDLFKYSANSLDPEIFLQLHEGWINQTIYDLPALCFERAVIVYRLLTGRFPYDCADQLERNADILDRKFLPLELCVNGINTTLAREVNRALLLNSNAVTIPGKKKSGKDTEDLRPKADFPLDLLEEAWKQSLSQTDNSNQKEFEEKVANYIRVRDSKIATRRNIRRNTTTIIGAVVVAVTLVIITISSVKAKGEEYTSKGLTATETLVTYFSGVNSKNTMLLTNFVKGKIPQNHVDAVSQVYVLDKQRHAYGNDNGFAYPENWLFYSTTFENYTRSGLYGATNLKIDGKPFEITEKAYKQNEHPEPVTKEGNISLNNKDESVHKVEYFLLHSEGEDNAFIVEKVFAVYTLTYVKDKWLITDITSDYQTVPVSCNTFKNDYLNQISLCDGDVITAVSKIRSKYPWLPTETSLEKEKALIEYRIAHPFETMF